MINKEKLTTIVKKALTINLQPTEVSFPELPDVLVWIRFTLGLAFGLFLGLRGIRSGALILQGINLITFLPVMYCRFYLATPPEQFGSQIIFSGTANAVALALLIWIYLFTSQHAEEEMKLAALLFSGGDGSGEAMGSDTGSAQVPVTEGVETEF